MAAPVVAAEPVWATLLAAKESVWGAIFELSVPGCSCPRAMQQQVDFDAATSTQLLLLSQFRLSFRRLRCHAAGVCRCCQTRRLQLRSS